MANTVDRTIYVLNGPNLNLLGTREPQTYGHATLADLEKLCVETAARYGLKADCRQSNHEGELIDIIHEAHARKAAGIIINAGGGPTDDKPAVTLETPRDPDRVSSFLNILVKDIAAVYTEWSARGAQFLTPPKQHQYEIRCYIRDPDGHLIEVGQTTDPQGDWTPAHWPSSTPAEESE